MRKTIVFIFLFNLLFSQSTWHVSTSGSDENSGSVENPFATIQAGIDASSDGDIINVYAGTYYENISLNGKSIHLFGQDRETTIIDAGGNGPGIQAIQTLTVTAEIKGFTIQNGQGLVGGWPSESHRAVGGGILVVYNNVLFEDLIIKNNTAEYGGGIFFQSSESNLVDLYFKNVDFSENNSPLISSAAWIRPSYTILNISDCEFENHTSDNPSIVEISGGNITVNLDDVLFNQNIGSLRIYAGGNQSSFNINQSTFTGNSSTWRGGALRFDGNDYTVTIDSSVFENNQTSMTETGGGALSIENPSTTTISNSSFVNKYLSHDIPVDEVVKNPIETAETSLESQNYLSNVKRPNNIFGSRVNSEGFDFSDLENLTSLQKSFKEFEKETFHASTLIASDIDIGGTKKAANCPGNTKVSIGSVTFSDANIVKVLEESKPSSSWGDIPLQSRKEILYRVSESLNLNRQKLFYLLSTEAGKTIKDCDAEVREAIDFIHYYISESEKMLKPLNLPGPSGENNFLSYEAKGNFLCISPWNFPLAIFVGQIAAALLTGNNVIAKPAEDTSIVAYEVVKMFHDAGVSTEALQLIIADKSVSNDLTKISWLDGIAFTGSGQAAKKINLNLANSEGPIKSFIAETGGLNVMFVDSSALKEQVIDDIIKSAFLSAGQRCSALRVVYVQEEIAEEYWDYLDEAMQELELGNPNKPTTDIGPIINESSLNKLTNHTSKLKANKEFIECDKNYLKNGYFIKPIAFKIDNINEVDGEKFGPILHFISYKSEDLDKIVEEVNATGFGLTMGVHSRITEKAHKIFEKAKVGNFYLNRDIVGAVVGVQPFGGQGLSGTGPKAGGPNYLKSFVTEKTFTDNVMATGGNIDLLNKNNQ